MSDMATTFSHPTSHNAVGHSSAKVGMAAFLCSEAAFFGTLLVAYLTYLGKSSAGPTPADVLQLPPVIVNSVFLLSSSGTIAIAMKSHGSNRTRSFLIWMLVTILLGGLFIAGTGYEWYRLIYHDGLTIGRNLFGTTFFTLIGFHAAHVTMGLVMMSVLVVLGRSRRLTPTNPAPELISWYWHFVDAVWVVIFSVVYVFGR